MAFRKGFIAAAIVVLVCSPAFAANRYIKCDTCAPVYKAAAVVQQVAYPQTIIENQFVNAAPYIQAPVTDAAYQKALLTSVEYRQQQIADTLQELKQRQLAPQMIVVYPQIHMQAQQQAACADEACEQPNGPPKFNQTASVMASCLKCHTKPGAAMDALDLTKPIECDQALAAMEAVATGSMPKGGKAFTADQLTQLRKELGEFNKRFEKPPTPPQEPVNEAPKDAEGGYSSATREWLKFAVAGGKK
jgi:hypothetical protein